MRAAIAVLLTLTATAVVAQAPGANPITQPSRLEPQWQARTRALFEQVVEIPTVINRGQVPRMAQLIAKELRAAGIPARDIRIIPHEGLAGDKTVTLIARWRADRPTKKPLLILGHMDVVEAKREDWKFDPFEFRE